MSSKNTLLSQYYPERRTSAYLWRADEYFAFVVVVDDSFRERQPQPPTTLFGGEPRFENVFEVLLGDTFARVFDVDEYIAARWLYIEWYFADAAHCVDGIFTEILYNPFEERNIDGCRDNLRCMGDGVIDFVRGAFAEIGDGVFDYLYYVLLLYYRGGANLREPLWDGS